MKRLLTLVILFTIGNILAKAMTAEPVMNKSEIKNCCDSLHPYFIPDNYSDTIFYHCCPR